jgi:uncharacterized protein YdaU (DUF1376 family)
MEGRKVSKESKRKAPAFQLYTDDFLAGTLEMSQEEVGQFIRLLCHQWNRGSIPVETEKQQRLTGGCVSVDVLAKFRLCEDGSLRNERLESVRTERGLFLQQQSIKGQQSAEKRRLAASAIQPELNQTSTEVQPDTQPDCQPTPQPESNSPSPSPSPKEDTKKEKALSPDLEAFRLRVGAMLRRRPSTKWSTGEIKKLKEVFDLNTPEEDLVRLEQRYKSKDPYLRKELDTLLNHWNGEIDKTQSDLISGNNPDAISAEVDWRKSI